jgi:hypothetical protein
MKNYLDCGEAKAILCGINRWARSEVREAFPSEITMCRIVDFIENILSKSDREAIKLDELDRRNFVWLAENSIEEKTRNAYRQALELDVDLSKLKNIIQGVRSEINVA